MIRKNHKAVFGDEIKQALHIMKNSTIGLKKEGVLYMHIYMRMNMYVKNMALN